MQLLNSMILKTDGNPSQLAKQLKTAVELLGTSLESHIFEQMQNSKSLPENNLLSIVRLQQSLAQAGKNELADVIGDFLKDLQQSQFLNTKPEPIPGQGDWTEIGFAIQNTQHKADEPFSSARLRIARESRGGSSKINPAYTRLILQVDLQPGQTVEVDLSVVDKQIRTLVTAPDRLWRQQAQEELPALMQALEDLGFTLKDTQISLGDPQSFDRLGTSDHSPLMTVDIEA